MNYLSLKNDRKALYILEQLSMIGKNEDFIYNKLIPLLENKQQQNSNQEEQRKTIFLQQELKKLIEHLEGTYLEKHDEPQFF